MRVVTFIIFVDYEIDSITHFEKMFLKKQDSVDKCRMARRGNSIFVVWKGVFFRLRTFIIGSLFFIVSTLISVTAVFADEAPQTELEKFATPLIGTPYQYGGTTTNAFDCSGFSSYIFEQFDIELARSSSSQAQLGKPIKKSELRAGDLVFFQTNGHSISHVGIYLENNQMIHASTNNGVEIRDINEQYYANTYVTARRVLNDQQYEAFATIPQPQPESKTKPKELSKEELKKHKQASVKTLQFLKEESIKNEQSAERKQQNEKMKEIFLSVSKDL